MLTALLAILACSAAHAAPSFLVGADRVTPGKDKVAVEYAPGQKIHLEAGFFEDGDPAKSVRDPDGTYEWQLRCGDAACDALALAPDDRGRVIEIPRDAPANLHILVSHTRPDGSVDGQAELDLSPAHAEGVPAGTHSSLASIVPERASHADEGEANGPRLKRHEILSHDRYEAHDGSATAGGHARQSRESRSGAHGSHGFGGGGSDDSGGHSSYRARRSRRSSSDSFYEGYSGAGGGSASSQGGLARDKEVAVLSCKNVAGADGRNQVVCEDQAHKLLRLKAKAPRKAFPKRVKKTLAKKPAKKTKKT